MMEAVHTSETSVDNHFTRQYIPEDNSEHNKLVYLHFLRKVRRIPYDQDKLQVPLATVYFA
jgi:hypothetical protein